MNEEYYESDNSEEQEEYGRTYYLDNEFSARPERFTVTNPNNDFFTFTDMIEAEGKEEVQELYGPQTRVETVKQEQQVILFQHLLIDSLNEDQKAEIQKEQDKARIRQLQIDNLLSTNPDLLSTAQLIDQMITKRPPNDPSLIQHDAFFRSSEIDLYQGNPKTLNRRLESYVKMYYNRAYLSLGLWDLDIPLGTPLDLFLDDKINDLSDKDIETCYKKLRDDRVPFGLGTLMELREHKSLKQISHITRWVKFIEIQIFRHVYQQERFTNMKLREEVIAAMQVVCSFTSKQLFRPGTLACGLTNTALDGYIQDLETTKSHYSPIIHVLAGRMPASVTEIFSQPQVEQSSTRRRIETFDYMKSQPATNLGIPCGVHLKNVIMQSDGQQYSFQKQILSAVDERIDVLLSKQPIMALAKKVVKFASQQMKEKGISITESFMNRHFKNENQFYEDCKIPDSLTEVLHEEDGERIIDYYQYSSHLGQPVQLTFKRLRHINELRITNRKQRTRVHQDYLNKNLKVLIKKPPNLRNFKNDKERQAYLEVWRKKPPEWWALANLNYDNQPREDPDLKPTLLRYQDCSSGPPILPSLEVSPKIHADGVSVYPCIVQNLFIGNVYVVENNPELVFKKDDVRGLFVYLRLRSHTDDRRFYEYYAGKMLDQLPNSSNNQVSSNEIKGYIQLDNVLLVETTSGARYMDINHQGVDGAAGSLDWGWNVERMVIDCWLPPAEPWSSAKSENAISLGCSHKIVNGIVEAEIDVYSQTGQLLKWEPSDAEELSYKFVPNSDSPKDLSFRVLISQSGSEDYMSPVIDSNGQFFGLFHEVLQNLVADMAFKFSPIEVSKVKAECANLQAVYFPPRDGYIQFKKLDDDQYKVLKPLLTRLPGQPRDGLNTIVFEVKTSANKTRAIVNFEKKSAYEREGVVPIIGSYAGLITPITFEEVVPERWLRILSWLVTQMYKKRLETMQAMTSLIIQRTFSVKNMLGAGRVAQPQLKPVNEPKPAVVEPDLITEDEAQILELEVGR